MVGMWRLILECMTDVVWIYSHVLFAHKEKGKRSAMLKIMIVLEYWYLMEYVIYMLSGIVSVSQEVWCFSIQGLLFLWAKNRHCCPLTDALVLAKANWILVDFIFSCCNMIEIDGFCWIAGFDCRWKEKHLEIWQLEMFSSSGSRPQTSGLMQNSSQGHFVMVTWKVASTFFLTRRVSYLWAD